MLIEVGGSIGTLNTAMLVVLTALIGSMMLRQQGLSTLFRARERIDSGQIPLQEMLEGVCLAVGGALLVTPGFITDAIGFACLLPPTRHMLVNAVSKRVSFAGVAGMAGSTASGAGSQSTGPAKRNRPPASGDVIEGEYTRKD